MSCSELQRAFKFVICMNRFATALPLFLFFFEFAWAGAGSSVDVTIDDSDPSHWFWGKDTWQAITPDHHCDACSAKLNASEPYNNTWHDASGNGASAQFIFTGQHPKWNHPISCLLFIMKNSTGSAVYMYGIDYINGGEHTTFHLLSLSFQRQVTLYR